MRKNKNFIVLFSNYVLDININFKSNVLDLKNSAFKKIGRSSLRILPKGSAPNFLSLKIQTAYPSSNTKMQPQTKFFQNSQKNLTQTTSKIPNSTNNKFKLTNIFTNQNTN